MVMGYSKNCSDISCYSSYQKACTRANYIRDTTSTTWQYEILDTEKNTCEIKVTALLIKEGTIERKTMEGLSMNCFLPIGELAYPGEDITLCHGLLKEEIQHLMIKNAHARILANMNEVNQEIAKEELSKVI